MNKEKSFSREEFLETWTNYIDDTVLFEMLDWIEAKVEEEKKKAVIEALEGMIEERKGWSGDGLQILTKKLAQLKND